jgi:hypothetical protein
MNPGTDTTARKRRYFTDAEIAEILQAMDRAYGRVAGDPVAADWPFLAPLAQRGWTEVVSAYRRGDSTREVYEARSGYPWGELPPIEQVRLEVGHLLVTGLASVER